MSFGIEKVQIFLFQFLFIILESPELSQVGGDIGLSITLVPKVFLFVASITWGCTLIYRPLSYPFRSLKLSTTIYLVLNSGSLDPSPCPQTSLTRASAGPTREARVVAPLGTDIYNYLRIFRSTYFFGFPKCV